jgi:putative drug exporter of the RND superfamily
MTGPLYELGRFCSRRHWIVIAVWVVAAVALVLGARASGDKTNDNLTLPGTGSTDAQNLLKERLPKQAYGSNPLVFKAGSGKLTDSTNKQAIDASIANVQKVPGVTSAINPLSSEGMAFLSKDGTIGYSPVTLDISPGSLTSAEAQQVLDAADPARKAGMQVAVGGYVGQQLSKPNTDKSDIIGLGAAVLILLFAFGTATAMALTIVTAVLGLACALAIIQLLGNLIDVPSVAPTLGTMIGLGVGIDYALFVVTRHKLQLKAGMEVKESIARAAATSGGAVCFAGGTVVIALCSLSVAGIPLVRNMGISAAVSVVVAVVAAVTLLPALLGLLGPRINSLRVHLGRTHPDDHEPHGWARWAREVSKSPVPVATISVIILLVLAIPILKLQLGQSDNGELPKSTTGRQSYDLISQGFGPGTTGPLLVAVQLGSPAKPDSSSASQVSQQQQELKATQQQIEQQALAGGASQQQAQQQAQTQTQSQSAALAQKQAQAAQTDPRLTKLRDDISKTPDVKTVSPFTLDSQGSAGVLTVIPNSSPSDEQTQQLVRTLRDSVIPSAVEGTDMSATVGGRTAAYIDLASRISDKLPLMIGVVVALSFLVLLLAFRSLIVPIKAAVMNLLSVAAAYGIVTFVFQLGHGAKLLGLEGDTPIVSFVPLMMFAILFGLSMDYEVFLVSQMQDHYKEDGEPTKAVIDGVATTGRVITSAALIMVCVFTSFVASGDPTVKQFGIGLAAAVAIDATIVRCMLVPAVMVMLGRWAWWLPKPIDRVLPHLSIEGEAYFAKRDAAAESEPVPAG